MYHAFLGGYRRHAPAFRRAAAALVLALAALPPISSPPAIALADNGFTDITGSPVQVDIRFPDKDSGSMIELPIASNQLNAQAQQFLATQLNQWFDQYWSGTPDKSGKTVRDNSCDAARSAAANAVNAATGQTAYEITCAFAATGTLGAKQSGNFLMLSYLLRNNVVGFKVTTPDACALGVCVGAPAALDPRFTLTFDTELQVSLAIPDSPCSLQVAAATVFTHNANIDSANLTGDLVKSVVDIFSGGTFSSAETQLDNATQPIQLNLGSTLNSLASGCDTARQQGFVQFDAPIDASVGRLTFRLTHPLDSAPGLVDTFAQAQALEKQSPLFQRPTIGLSQSEVSPGAQIAVTGTAFQPAETNLQITWTDTTSGPVQESDIQWGPQGGQIQTVNQPRNGASAQPNQFETGNLTPGATYQVRVRDCDAITCTPWSDWLSATMAPKGGDQVLLFLDSETQSNQIGSSTLNGDGTFSTQASIASTASSGTHTLLANVGGAIQSSALPVHLATGTHSSGIVSHALASGVAKAPPPQVVHPVQTGIMEHAVPDTGVIAAIQNPVVLAGGQNASATVTVCSGSACQPVLQVVDPTTQTAITSVLEGDQVTVHGAGFPPGEVIVSFDSPSGQVLGGGGVGSEGSFTAQVIIPRGETGNHSLVGVERATGRTVQATDNLFVEQIPR